MSRRSARIWDVRAQFGLASLFRESELRDAAFKLSGVSPDHTIYAENLAMRILEIIGFPCPTPILGLQGVRRMFEGAQRRIGLYERAQLVGEIVSLGVAMESLLSMVLRFHCIRSTGLAPSRWLAQLPKPPGGNFDKPTMGTLVSSIHLLDNHIRMGTGEALDRYRILFGSPTLFVPVLHVLPQLRNHFSHDRSGDGGAPQPLSVLRIHAKEFVEAGLCALDHFGGRIGDVGRLCPFVIRVERVVLDTWARRTIEAVNDEGHHEVLFTEESLRPGQVFLMNPLTNPLRVTPVLVQVRDSLQMKS